MDSADSSHLSDQSLEKHRYSTSGRIHKTGPSVINHGGRDYIRHESFRKKRRGNYPSRFGGKFHSYNDESKDLHHRSHRDYEGDDYLIELHKYDYSRQKDRERERATSWKRKYYDRESTFDEEDADSFQKDDTCSEEFREEKREQRFNKRCKNESDTSSYEKYDTDVTMDYKLCNNNDRKSNNKGLIAVSEVHELHGAANKNNHDNSKQSSPVMKIQDDSGGIIDDDAVKSSILLDLSSSDYRDGRESISVKAEPSVNDEQKVTNIFAPDLQKFEADSIGRLSVESLESHSMEYSAEIALKADSSPVSSSKNKHNDNNNNNEINAALQDTVQTKPNTTIKSNEVNCDCAPVVETLDSQKPDPDVSVAAPELTAKSSEVSHLNSKLSVNTGGVQTATVHEDLSSTNLPLNVHDLLQRYPVVWQGALMLKNDTVVVQMHLVCGSKAIADESLSVYCKDGRNSPLKIAQRMKLETTQLESVSKRMQVIISY